MTSIIKSALKRVDGVIVKELGSILDQKGLNLQYLLRHHLLRNSEAILS